MPGTDGVMTPAKLVQSLLDLDDPRSIEMRRTITLSEILDWARQAREAESPSPTTVERAARILDDLGLQLAIFAPHGMDSARVGDYHFAADMRRLLDNLREALGLERVHT